jgi:hypothetical protein
MSSVARRKLAEIACGFKDGDLPDGWWNDDLGRIIGAIITAGKVDANQARRLGTAIKFIAQLNALGSENLEGLLGEAEKSLDIATKYFKNMYGVPGITSSSIDASFATLTKEVVAFVEKKFPATKRGLTTHFKYIWNCPCTTSAERTNLMLLMEKFFTNAASDVIVADGDQTRHIVELNSQCEELQKCSAALKMHMNDYYLMSRIDEKIEHKMIVAAGKFLKFKFPADKARQDTLLKQYADKAITLDGILAAV